MQHFCADLGLVPARRVRGRRPGAQSGAPRPRIQQLGTVHRDAVLANDKGYQTANEIYRLDRAGGAVGLGDRGQKPFIKEWGSQSEARWSPDGTKIAFDSARVDHSFIGIYDVASRTVKYLAPSVDFDTGPSWSEDGKLVAFMRRPGLAFGQQRQSGSGSIGNPSGPAVGGGSALCPAPARGDGQGDAPPDTTHSNVKEVPGLCKATFHGGHTLSVMVGDAGTLQGREVWHPAAKDSTFAVVYATIFAGDRLVMPTNAPNDEWERYWSISATGSATQQPVMLTTTNGLASAVPSARGTTARPSAPKKRAEVDSPPAPSSTR